MDPVRALLDVLVVFTAIVVILWLLFSKSRNPANNPLVLSVMVFLSTLIVWLAFLGTARILQGYRPLPISSQTLILVCLFVAIAAVSFFKPRNHRNPLHILILILGSIWVLLVSILAVIGLSCITSTYATTHIATWAISSLAITFVLELVLLFQRYRRGGKEDAKGHALSREDNTRRTDDL